MTVDDLLNKAIPDLDDKLLFIQEEVAKMSREELMAFISRILEIIKSFEGYRIYKP